MRAGEGQQMWHVLIQPDLRSMQLLGNDIMLAALSYYLLSPNIFPLVSRSFDILFNMVQLEDDPIQAGQVPLTIHLCLQLGLGEISSNRSSMVRKSLINWRKTYRAPDGVTGMSLFRWNQRDREYLGVMALKYLETDGNGHEYWPPNGFYEYPKDSKE